MAELKVMLADDQEGDLKKYIYDITLEAIQQARKDSSVDKDLINKTQLCEWLDISMPKLNELIRDGLPISVVGERTFFASKQEVRKWILEHKK
ncbi:hypothetical protein [Vagococcus xieshaowenii]|uniref:Helix-turn-helix domain-containing protein n=1 Tax=Vagococcus xieshaowenii TaxID=2562451 RepID=A0AAJ5EGW4_9ENTE|nr:hypothetical protein [Vagococcus xieshaowenii]QCA28899.1 hypothetical protein E4Z98_06035 [Vagococcus xieshaowenii]TFZ43317.1 hypothetical protein E4031_00405 [Vagococcus xieshaowenii]